MGETPHIPQHLGDGLILRRSTAADAEALAAFNARIHGDHETGEPADGVAGWTRELLRGNHPTFCTDDFTIVEDTRTGQVVSSLNLISQVWSYGGIEFGVGRPELVGTDPGYRRRGLVRRQMDLVHAWSAERGHLLQGITGIPWYYRQFGYEMALDLGGGRYGYGPQVPRLKEGETEPFRLRPAGEADLPFIAQLYDQGRKRYRVSCVRDAAMWRRELYASPESDARRELAIIETPDGQPAGLLAYPAILWHRTIPATLYELSQGVSWLAATPSVIRYLWAIGQAYGSRQRQEVEAFGMSLGLEHPAYDAARRYLVRTRAPYAWYLRVPNLAGFVRHVAPAIELNLASSPADGHSGELKLTFYRSGLRLVLDKGRLVRVEDWESPFDEESDAGFPGLTFLQLLFGYRSLEELRYAFADCWADDRAHVLLAGLFPKQVSLVWPVA